MPATPCLNRSWWDGMTGTWFFPLLAERVKVVVRRESDGSAILKIPPLLASLSPAMRWRNSSTERSRPFSSARPISVLLTPPHDDRAPRDVSLLYTDGALIVTRVSGG